MLVRNSKNIIYKRIGSQSVSTVSTTITLKDGVLFDDAFIKEWFGIDGFWELADGTEVVPTIKPDMKKSDVDTQYLKLKKDSSNLMSFMLSPSGTWDIQIFPTTKIIEVIQGYATIELTRDIRPKLNGTSTTTKEQVDKFFNDNNQPIKGGDNLTEFTNRNAWTLTLNLVGGVVKHFNTISQHWDGDPFVLYPNYLAAQDNSGELFYISPSSWSSAGKWSYIPAGSGSVNTGTRTRVEVSSFTIIKVG